MSNVVRLIALKMKETGADVHAIGDGGFAGCTSPENIHQLSVSIKGRPYTYSAWQAPTSDPQTTACRCTLRRCASVKKIRSVSV